MRSRRQRSVFTLIYWAIAGVCLPLGFSSGLGALGFLGLVMFLYGSLRNRSRMIVGFVVGVLTATWLLWVQQHVSLTGAAWWLASAFVIARGIVVALGLERAWESDLAEGNRG